MRSIANLLANLLASLLVSAACNAGDTEVHAADQDVTAATSRLNVRHIRGYDYVLSINKRYRGSCFGFG